MIKNNRGITLVSLVVTIVILIILAGVSINMTLGEGGIITIAKRAKENMQLAQMEEQKELNELYSKIEQNGGLTGEEINYDIIAKLNNFKKQIADYIEEAGGIKPEYTADAEIFGERIKGIVKEVTKNATATAENIEEGKTAWVNGEKIIGTKKLGNPDSTKFIIYKTNAGTRNTFYLPQGIYIYFLTSGGGGGTSVSGSTFQSNATNDPGYTYYGTCNTSISNVVTQSVNAGDHVATAIFYRISD